MKVWVVIGSDGGSDSFVLAGYLKENAARLRTRRENCNQSYYDYRMQPIQVYPKRKRKGREEQVRG